MPEQSNPALSARQLSATHSAVAFLCSADYDLACAARLFEESGHPAAEESEVLFQAALAFRQKMDGLIHG